MRQTSYTSLVILRLFVEINPFKRENRANRVYLNEGLYAGHDVGGLVSKTDP